VIRYAKNHGTKHRPWSRLLPLCRAQRPSVKPTARAAVSPKTWLRCPGPQQDCPCLTQVS
jgi:hypothetical protein